MPPRALQGGIKSSVYGVLAFITALLAKAHRAYCAAKATATRQSSSDGTVQLWDIEVGKRLAVFKGHSNWVQSVALGRVNDRDVIISGGDDGTVRLWDIGFGEMFAVFRGHSNWVQSVALGRVNDRDVIVSGGDDGTVQLWDAKSGERLAVFDGQSSRILSVAVGRMGGRDMIVSGGSDSTVRIWDVVEALASPKTMHQIVLGPGRNTLMDLTPDGKGGNHIQRASGDLWRYFLAQGHTPDGKIVTAPIEAMMTDEALAAAK